MFLRELVPCRSRVESIARNIKIISKRAIDERGSCTGDVRSA
ncbi:MAG: hypothetical protein WBA89_18200 [Microcoleus sp.]